MGEAQTEMVEDLGCGGTALTATMTILEDLR